MILPTPLFEAKSEYIHCKTTLKKNAETQIWSHILQKCRKNQRMSYSFIMFFIHQYSNFYKNVQSYDQFEQISENRREDFEKCFEKIGYKFLYWLCKNFRDNSYFRLKNEMTKDEVHRRLLVLNIAAVFLSSKAHPKVTLISSILFDQRQKMPQNYGDHLKFYKQPGPVSTLLKGLIRWLVHIHYNPKAITKTEYSTLT